MERKTLNPKLQGWMQTFISTGILWIDFLSYSEGMHLLGVLIVEVVFISPLPHATNSN